MSKLLTGIVFLIGAVLIFSFWTLPLFHDIQGLSRERDKFREIFAASQELKDARDALLGKYNNMVEELASADKLLPASADNKGLIIEFDNLTKTYGLALKNLSITEKQEQKTPFFSQKKAKKSFEKIAVDFKVSGRYENLLAFMKDLENSLRVIDVESISFSAGKSGVYEFDIGANAYMLPDEKTGGKKMDLLSLLSILKSTALDESFFQNPIFTKLRDFSTGPSIANVAAGRPNPFSPI